MKSSLFQGEVKPKMLTRVSLDLDRHQKLADMALRMFGGVEQKAEDRGGKASAAHESRLSQYRLVDLAKLLQRFIHLTMERRNEVLRGLGGISGVSLAFQILQLRGGERFTP